MIQKLRLFIFSRRRLLRSPPALLTSIQERFAMRTMLRRGLTVVLIITCFCVVRSRFVTAQSSPPPIGERPALQKHVNQADIENAAIEFKELLETGESVFAARWTKLDGQGRPAATGNGAPTKRNPLNDPGFIRTSGTDSTSCADCHNQPTIGGAGGVVAYVFLLAPNPAPGTHSRSSAVSNQRD